MHFSERLDRLTSSLIRELLALTQQPDMISFAGGLPAARAMPPLGLAGVPETLRQYGTTDGEPELRATIARYLTGLGRSCTAEQVLITSGSQQGLDLVSKLFIDPGTTVAVEAPSYLAALQAFRFFGAEFLELPLGAGGLDPQQLRDAIRQRRPAFLYLIPTFQNPSGLCYDEATRAAVAEVLSESGVPLLEDEPYRELVYEPCDRTPICTRLADGAPWMVMGSFSKTGIPGLRIGYIAASSDIHPHLVRIKQCTDLHTNRIGQWWANQFMQSAGYLDHLDRLRDYYRAQRDAMQAGLQRYLADLATWQRPHGGLFFWITLNEAVDERELLQEVLARKVAFMPGGAFYATPPARQGRMRLNFSHSTPEQVDRGLRVLGDTVREHLGRHSRRHATTG
ncbi:PLP-dependent aminotransferase family protein [Plasticicumulans acidivorans]|uniref:DNA-binding transcriptional MocR family regulator n=1 Tax=Plasticicumulans acidivorans TaxID=886464 RepID=A0A317MRZ5_9GAMM|nr:PLP-dependent aminotransferase family protein [Plasticicumulans acidivorans]PWV58715.1 DNA-binding transcriptional MocR family regulator [Plasticicumulans acidivorans]